MPRFDAYAPDFLENPYPTYALLRAAGPFFYDDQWDLLFFTRHADVRAMLRDRRFGRDARHVVPMAQLDQTALARERPMAYPNWTHFIRGSFMDMEPPAHTRIRRLVQAAFSRRSAESYRRRMEETANTLLDRMLEKGSAEAIADYATPIPLVMISELMGVPAEDQMHLVDWSTAIVRLFDERCTAEEGAAAEEATIEFVEYLRHMMASRTDMPREDLVTALMEAEIEGERLNADEVVATSILALNASHEATVQAIGNGLIALAHDQGEFQRLRVEPDLMKTAVDELLRFDTPLQMFERWVLEDTDWAGTHLRRGTKIGLLLGSANHDDEVFAEPERLNLGRQENPHISFGGGTHYCVGAPLARVELEVAVSCFARRVTDFELATDRLERPESLVFRGVRSLPVAMSG